MRLLSYDGKDYGYDDSGSRSDSPAAVDISKAKIDPEALSTLMDVLRRLQDSNGSLLGQTAPLDELCSSYIVPFRNDPLKVDADKKAVQEATELRLDYLNAIEALDTIRQCLSIQACELDNHVKACTLRSGFSSLPDEIICNVLEHAALQSMSETDGWGIVRTVKAATRLSHVCRHFRQLAMGLPNFWDGWVDFMHPEMASACVARCQNNAKLLVHSPFFEHETGGLNLNSYNKTEGFLRNALRNLGCWSRFVLFGQGSPRDINGFIFSDKELALLARMTNGVFLPSLTDFAIHYDGDVLYHRAHDRVVNPTPIHFYSSWSTPRLQNVSTSNLIPVPFSGSQSLKSFSLNIDFFDKLNPDTLDVGATLSFLSSCPVLEDIKIEINRADSAIQPMLARRPLEMTSVNNAHFHFSLCKAKAIRTIFENVHFPNAAMLVLRIGTYVFAECRDDSKAQNIIQAVFQSAKVFPNISSLTLKIYDGDSRHVSLHQLPSIPSSYIPKLKHLDLRPPLLDIETEPVPKLPALRTLVLRGHCFFDSFFVPLLRALDAQGHLNSLAWVRFEDGHDLEIVVNGVQVSKESFTLTNADLRKYVEGSSEAA